MPKLERTDALFDVSDQPDVQYGDDVIRPQTAHVEHFIGEAVTVYLRGPSVRASGLVTKRRIRAIYGRYGIPLPEAPKWIFDLAMRVLKMEDSDAEA